MVRSKNRLVYSHLYDENDCGTSICCPGLEIQYTRRSKVGFLFSMRNKLGQVKTFSNERKKGLSFRDFFTRNLDNVTRKACVYYRPPTGMTIFIKWIVK